jgi:2-keto-4-pentenoate hydratase
VNRPDAESAIPAAPISSAAIAAAAGRLREAYRQRQPCAPVRDVLGVNDLTAAYAVQDVNTRRWLEDGRRLVGRKIGLTSTAVQAQMGVHAPDYGMLFADMAVADGEEVLTQELLQPRVEGEVAFCLNRDLTDPQSTMADVIRAVDFAVAAIEIVASRIERWDIKITDTIADNASSGRYVLGNEPHRLGDFDSRLCGMVLERRGEPVSLGAGAACLGNPLNATLWLARKMAAIGRPLQAGDLVLSGALGPMVAARPGDVFDLRINGLGSVRAVFSRGVSP